MRASTSFLGKKAEGTAYEAVKLAGVDRSTL
jgi:hypothetical protein